MMAGKTAAAVLQEMMVKLGMTPEYECVAQSGPQHSAKFEYRSSALGETATVVARSKKEAKQESAKALLGKLARKGHSVPAPWGMQCAAAEIKPEPEADEDAAAHVPDVRSYVALLTEYCTEYRLPMPEWTLIGDSGPPHLRSFTIRVSVGAHSRDATALSKKAARQAAAEAIYKALRACLRSTQDFVEGDALVRAVDKRMGRADERKDQPWRPPLDLKVTEYQLGLVLQFNEERRAQAMEALRTTQAAGQPHSVQLECAAAALGLEPVWDEMPSNTGTPLASVELPTTTPSLLFIGTDKDDATRRMNCYLEMFLMNPPKDSALDIHEQAELRKQEVAEKRKLDAAKRHNYDHESPVGML